MPIIAPRNQQLAPSARCPERRFVPGRSVPHTVAECDERLARLDARDRAVDVWLDERLRAMHIKPS